LIRRVRARLFVLAVVIALAAGVVCRLLLQIDADELASRVETAPFVVAIGAFVVAIAAGWVTHAMMRRSLRELASATRDVVRDTSRRIPPMAASPDDEVRQLAEWVNFLAEDADRSHRGLAHERVLLSTVAEGLTQGVIAVDADHKIELLNDALPQPMPAPMTPVVYTPVLDGGLALYKSDGTLHPIQWTSFIVGGQYYINKMVWVAANYSHMSSGNAHLFTNNAPTKVFDTSNWADGNLFVDLTPAVRLGAEFSWFNQTYVDTTDATDYRGQFSAFFIF
jgi:hypothetical protein